MNRPQTCFYAAAAGLIMLSASSRAAVLQSWAGPTTVTAGGDGIELVNTATDTGDWITSNGNYTTGSATTPLYFQFTLTVNNNVGESGGGGFFTGFQLMTGPATATVVNERLAVGNNWASVNWGGFESGGGNYDLNGNPGAGGPNPITPAETVSFVMRLDQATSSATVWFNPNMSLAEAAQDPGLTTNLTGLGVEDTFNSIWMRAGNGAGSTTFSAMSVHDVAPFGVVPEPSSALFSALAGLALLSIRRRC